MHYSFVGKVILKKEQKEKESNVFMVTFLFTMSTRWDALTVFTA